MMTMPLFWGAILFFSLVFYWLGAQMSKESMAILAEENKQLSAENKYLKTSQGYKTLRNPRRKDERPRSMFCPCGGEYVPGKDGRICRICGEKEFSERGPDG